MHSKTSFLFTTNSFTSGSQSFLNLVKKAAITPISPSAAMLGYIRKFNIIVYCDIRIYSTVAKKPFL